MPILKRLDAPHRMYTGSALDTLRDCTDELQASCLRSKSAVELQAVFNNLSIINTGFGHDGFLSVRGPLQATIAPFVDGHIVPAQPSQVGVQVPAIFGSSKQTISSHRAS